MPIQNIRENKYSSIMEELLSREMGDRRLDEAIMTFVYGDPIPRGNIGEERTLHWELSPGLYYRVALHFTTSCDDALTLIPSNWEIEYIMNLDGKWHTKIRCKTHNPPIFRLVIAKVMEMSIVGAALLVRQALQNERL